MESGVARTIAWSGSESPTLGTLWHAISGSEFSDEILDWPPDIFAFTDVVLERSDAYRFAVSPPKGRRWPPSSVGLWNTAVASAARDWSERVGTDRTPLPQLVSEEWSVVRNGITAPLDELGDGEPWRLCEALLTLHALADEACAGTGVAVELAGAGLRFRGRARERLARTGSLSRVSRRRLRVLPRVHSTPVGISFRSLSRYLCVRGPSVEAVWSKAPLRERATDDASPQANVLLLPWPLRVEETDFHRLGAVKRAEQEPYGFFEFAPSETLDLGLADQSLAAARAEAGSVDVVVLPESAVEPADLETLESVLARHRVTMLIAGVREAPGPAGGLGGNWLHLAVRFGGRWWHYRQNKHHRWSLDEGQIEQYQLAEVLPPAVRWWEAMEVPRREVQVLELGEGITLVSLVCEDLARLDEVADLLRAIGPTLVVTILLDGPQLPSRWTARYASVLADDPGSAVLTLSSFGFVQRSRPAGRAPSSVVSFWKDPVRGLREISLEPGAHGALVSVEVGRTTRRSADGRFPIANAAELLVGGVRPIRVDARADDASDAPAGPPGDRSLDARPAPVSTTDLTILTSWAELMAEALSSAPDRMTAVLEDAHPGASWRACAGLEEQSPELAEALGHLAEMVKAPDGQTRASAKSVLAAIRDQPESSRHDRDGELWRLARAVLRPVLEWQHRPIGE
jgi:hypothetical protein